MAAVLEAPVELAERVARAVQVVPAGRALVADLTVTPVLAVARVGPQEVTQEERVRLQVEVLALVEPQEVAPVECPAQVPAPVRVHRAQERALAGALRQVVLAALKKEVLQAEAQIARVRALREDPRAGSLI